MYFFIWTSKSTAGKQNDIILEVPITYVETAYNRDSTNQKSIDLKEKNVANLKSNISLKNHRC